MPDRLRKFYDGNRILIVGDPTAFPRDLAPVMSYDGATLASTLARFVDSDTEAHDLATLTDALSGESHVDRRPQTVMARIADLANQGRVAVLEVMNAAHEARYEPDHESDGYDPDTAQKMERILSYLPEYLGEDTAKEFMGLLDPVTIGITIALLIGAFLSGIGGAVLLAVGFAFAGWSIFGAIREFGRFAEAYGDAKDERAYRACAQILSRAIAALGVGTFVAIVTRGAGRVARMRRVRAGRGAGTDGNMQPSRPDRRLSNRRDDTPAPTRTNRVFQESGSATHLRRKVEVDGRTIQINSGHGYNRPHATGDVRNSGLSMDQIDGAVVDDIAKNMNTIDMPTVPASASRTIDIDGYSLTYDVTTLKNGTISVSTYYPGE